MVPNRIFGPVIRIRHIGLVSLQCSLFIVLIATAVLAQVPREAAGLERPSGETLAGAQEAWVATFGKDRTASSVVANLQDGNKLSSQVQSIITASAEFPVSVRVLQMKLVDTSASVIYRVFANNLEVGALHQGREMFTNGAWHVSMETWCDTYDTGPFQCPGGATPKDGLRARKLIEASIYDSLERGPLTKQLSIVSGGSHLTSFIVWDPRIEHVSRIHIDFEGPKLAGIQFIIGRDRRNAQVSGDAILTGGTWKLTMNTWCTAIMTAYAKPSCPL
jgi:hypothetical protein